MRRTTLILVAALVIFSSCRTRKQRSARFLRRHADTGKLVLPEIRGVINNGFEFDYLSFKSKCDYKDPNMDQSFTMNFRMKYDSIMWVSLSAVGFEVARAKLDKDSIRIINRLEKKSYVYDYAFIKKLAGTELSLLQIQYLLTANLLFPPENYGQTADADKFKTTSGYIENTVTLDGKSKILEQFLQHLVEQTNADVVYKDYKKVDKQMFPGKIDIAIKAPRGELTLKMENSGVSDALIDAFPFEVPAKYEKAH